MACATCGKDVTERDSFEHGKGRLCAGCFMDAAQAIRTLTPDQRDRLKKMVKEEMAGVLPRAIVRQHVEDCLAAVLKGHDEDEAINRAVNEIERTAGLAMLQHMLDSIGSVRKAFEGEEDEIRQKIRKVSQL